MLHPGYIKLTRPYIPGQAIWGAATALLTRMYGSGTLDYQRFGEFVKNNSIFSYFYPTLDLDKEPLSPRFTENGLMYGPYNEADFQKIFIGSTTQTAVDPDSNTATDESLHESEYIRPKVTIDTDGPRDVYFIGYLFINEKKTTLEDGKTISWTGGDYDLKKALKTLFIGGDIKYGWGRLRWCEGLSGREEKQVFGYPFTTSIEGVKLIITGGAPIPAHYIINENREYKVKGDIEPLVGRRYSTSDRGSGQDLVSSGYSWVPGSIVQDEAELTVRPYGVLA